MLDDLHVVGTVLDNYSTYSCCNTLYFFILVLPIYIYKNTINHSE